MRVETVDHIAHVLQFFEGTLLVLHLLDLLFKTDDVLLGLLVIEEVRLPELYELLIPLGEVISLVLHL